jgi:P4 family phage/plasmid primase-like protien
MFADYSRKFYESGYSVIPVKNKSPEIANWSQYCDKMADEEVFSYWESSFKDHSIGLCLGKASGVVAFDYDYEGSDEKIVENIIKGLLPPSPVKKVGKKGYTSFYRFSGQENISVNRGKKRVFDFLSSGRQTVVPPSIHPLGMAYKWITPTTLLDVERDELPELDQDILNQLKALLQSDTDELLEERIVTAIPRHDLCVGYIFKAMIRMSTEKEIAEAVVKYDNDNFLAGLYDGKQPYFEDKKYFSNKRPEVAALELVRRIIKWARAKSARTGVIFKLGQKTEVSTASTGFHFVVERVNKKTGEVMVTRTPDYYGFARWAQDNVNGFTDEAGTFYIYKDGFFQPLPEIGVEKFIIEKSADTVKPNEINNFIKILKGKSFNPPSKKTDGFINLKNGILDVKNKKVLPHSADYAFFYKLDVEFNPEATAPVWESALNNIFKGDRELIDLIHDIFGYILIGGHPYHHKAFNFYGIGGNGKSTVLDALFNLVGQDNVSTVPISALDKPFSAVMLENKLVNINGELTDSDISSAAFKDCVAGGYILGAKKFKDEKTFKVNCRFIFSSNNFPVFKDASHGIGRRLVLIPFENIFDESNADYSIGDKIKLEMAGILNLALQGLDRVNKRGFIEPAAAKELKNEYKQESDPVFAWLDDNCQFQEGYQSSIDTLYSDFVLFCNFQGRTPCSKVHFSRRVQSAAINHPDYPNSKIIRSRSKKSRLFSGIKIKSTT